MKEVDENKLTENTPVSPVINILAQYMKKLLFENPNTSKALAIPKETPQISVNVSVRGKSLSNSDFEVDLEIKAKATQEEFVIFDAELIYTGVFRLSGIPKERLQSFVLIECPRLLFPFVRNIIADVTHNGGYAPLLLDPIDFAALYNQNMMQEVQQDGCRKTIN